MMQNNKINSGEIDFKEIIITIWNGKWKIIFTLVITLIIGFIYKNHNKDMPKNFTAVSEIHPIITLEEYKYSSLNNVMFRKKRQINTKEDEKQKNLYVIYNITDYSNDINNNFINVTKEKLFDLYIENLNQKTLFVDAIRKYKLLDQSQYANEQAYSIAIKKLASSINISVTENKDKKLEDVIFLKGTIKINYNNEKKWKDVLKYVDKATNNALRENLNAQFQRAIAEKRKNREYQIEDIAEAMENLLLSYDSKVSNRLSYLREQAKIARELDIGQTTIEVQTFGNNNAYLSNVQTDSPFYLRGYVAIEKEIELIKSRTNKKVFIDNLIELEDLERKILQDKSLERAELFFKSTPLASENFIAATIKTTETKFLYDHFNQKVFLFIVILIGLLVGVVYVFVSNVIAPKKGVEDIN
mgnify:FL=1